MVLNEIEWKRFEIVCTEFFRLVGMDPRETNIGADGGVDIRVYKNTATPKDKPEAIVQCKAWNTYKVGVKLARELYGIMAAEQVDQGVLITSGEFTNEAKEFAEGKKLTLVSGERLLGQIARLKEEDQKRLLSIALHGDYKTPTCPRCDIKMVPREGKQGLKFWGCKNFPRCRQKLWGNKREAHTADS